MTSSCNEDGRPKKDDVDSPFATFRLGVVVSPVASVDAGLDLTLPRLRLAKTLVSRMDLDAEAFFRSPSFGSRRDASLGLYLCQVYAPGGVNRGRFYGGAGIGPYLGKHSALGGKVFIGTQVSPVISFEFEGQFPGDGTIRPVAMVRLSAL